MSKSEKLLVKLLRGASDGNFSFDELRTLVLSFIAEVPELPGCMADGDTYQEALANAEVIIREWIEIALSMNRDIPKPKGRLLFA